MSVIDSDNELRAIVEKMNLPDIERPVIERPVKEIQDQPIDAGRIVGQMVF